MTQLEKTVIVMQVLSQRFPRISARELVDLSATIVEKLSEPRTKIVENKPVFDNGGRSGA